MAHFTWKNSNFEYTAVKNFNHVQKYIDFSHAKPLISKLGDPNQRSNGWTKSRNYYNYLAEDRRKRSEDPIKSDIKEQVGQQQQAEGPSGEPTLAVASKSENREAPLPQTSGSYSIWGVSRQSQPQDEKRRSVVIKKLIFQ